MDNISYDDFSKLDMRVGTIIEAEKMPKANKLLVLKVDTGLDTRTIVSGIANSFKPEDIVGKKVTVVANLAPTSPILRPSSRQPAQKFLENRAQDAKHRSKIPQGDSRPQFDWFS